MFVLKVCHAASCSQNRETKCCFVGVCITPKLSCENVICEGSADASVGMTGLCFADYQCLGGSSTTLGMTALRLLGMTEELISIRSIGTFFFLFTLLS